MENFDLKKYLAEGKLHEAMFDVETTKRIAQQVADAFTAEDNELDLKYVVSPDVSAHSFDLDVEAGPNTPGEDWKDENGFDISNYLGAYAGGSFYIRDGVVYNAAMRNAPVANVSPEGEIEMISAEDSRAAIGMEEGEENKPSNKMKKSELKEMIKAAMLNEASQFQGIGAGISANKDKDRARALNIAFLADDGKRGVSATTALEIKKNYQVLDKALVKMVDLLVEAYEQCEEFYTPNSDVMKAMQAELDMFEALMDGIDMSALPQVYKTL